MLRFNCGRRKIWSDIKESQNIITIIEDSNGIIVYFQVMAVNSAFPSDKFWLLVEC